VRFLYDVHISIKLSKLLERLGHQSEHVNNILDRWNTKDSDISFYADEHDQILITKDQDFRNSYVLNKKPKKILKINLGNISNLYLLHMAETNIPRISALYEQFDSFMTEVNNDDFWTITK